MDNSNQNESSKSKRFLPAVVLGAAAIFVTAGVVSWLTPDGNLVVTLAPALAAGLTAFGVTLWRIRHGESE